LLRLRAIALALRVVEAARYRACASRTADDVEICKAVGGQSNPELRLGLWFVAHLFFNLRQHLLDLDGVRCIRAEL